MADSSTFYVINQSDTNPVIGGVDTFHSGDVISLVYQANATSDVKLFTSMGEPITGVGYKVVEITQTDAQGQLTTYTTPEFMQHPHSYYENYWPVGGALIAFGLAFLVIVNVVAFILKRHNKQIDIDVDPSQFMAPLGKQAGRNIYQQPEIVLYPQNALQPGADESRN